MSRFDFNLIRVLSITSKGLGNIHLSGSRKKRTISHKKGLKSRYEKFRVDAISKRLSYSLLQKTTLALGPYESKKAIFRTTGLPAPAREASKLLASQY